MEKNKYLPDVIRVNSREDVTLEYLKRNAGAPKGPLLFSSDIVMSLIHEIEELADIAKRLDDERRTCVLHITPEILIEYCDENCEVIPGIVMQEDLEKIATMLRETYHDARMWHLDVPVILDRVLKE